MLETDPPWDSIFMYTLLKNSVITGDDALDEFPVKSHQINYYSLTMYTKKISKIFQMKKGAHRQDIY